MSPDAHDRAPGPPGALEELEARMRAMRITARVGLLRRCTALEGYVDAIDQGSPDQARHHDAVVHAHQLVGTAGTFGFTRGSELAREIEAALLAGDDAEGADPGRLVSLVGQLRGALEPPDDNDRDTAPAAHDSRLTTRATGTAFLGRGAVPVR